MKYTVHTLLHVAIRLKTIGGSSSHSLWGVKLMHTLLDRHPAANCIHCEHSLRWAAPSLTVKVDGDGVRPLRLCGVLWSPVLHFAEEHWVLVLFYWLHVQGVPKCVETWRLLHNYGNHVGIWRRANKQKHVNKQLNNLSFLVYPPGDSYPCPCL